MRPKKLRLTRITVAALNDDELSQVRGASFYHECTLNTKSCSVYMECCKPPENLVENNFGV